MPLAAAGKIYSDDDVAAMENSAAPQAKKIYSDDEVSAMENPSNIRAGMASRQPLDLMKKFNEMGYKTAIPGFATDAMNGALDAANTATLGNISYSPAVRNAIDLARAESPNATWYGRRAGDLALGAGSTMLPGGPLVLGGAQGLLTRPDTAQPGIGGDLAARGGQGVVGAGVGAGLGIAGNLLSRSGNWAMQNAVNMPKTIPDIPDMGNRIANEGLWGTRGMMKQQINGSENPGMIESVLQKLGITNKLPAREAVLDQVIPQMQGTVPTKPSEDAVNKMMGKLVPSGNAAIDPLNVPQLNAGMDRLIAISNRGNLPPADALSAYRAMDQSLYDPDVAIQRYNKSLAKADSGAGRAALKDMADAQNLPQVRDALGSEQALITAKDAMEQPTSLKQHLIRHVNRGVVGAGISAAMGHGLPGMAAGIAGTEMLASPMGMSTLGQIGTQGAKAIPYMTPATIDELIRQSKQPQGGQP